VYIDITHALNWNIQLSLSLAQQFLFETFCAPKFNQYHTHFFLSFLAVQYLIVQIFLLLFTIFIILHRNLTGINLKKIIRQSPITILPMNLAGEFPHNIEAVFLLGSIPP
jgi:hypothetical protein